MFTKTTDTQLMLDTEIQSALVKMKDLDKDSKEYADLLEVVSKLHKLKAEEKPKQISPDTMLIVGANLFGILSIIHHEKLHPITSKAMSHVIKLR